MRNLRIQLVGRVVAWAACLICGPAVAARVLFYSSEGASPLVEERLKLSCRFYGIDLEQGAGASVSETPTATVIEAGALGGVMPEDLPEGNRGVLIAGINSRTPPAPLRIWAGEGVEPTDQGITDARDSWIAVSDDWPELTAELTGTGIPVDIAEGAQIRSAVVRTVLSYVDGTALFAVADSPQPPVFLLADLLVIDPPGSSIRFYDCGSFAEIAPYMMFLRKTFGEYAWHTDGDYANLTIDDPWLCDSYGNLMFRELLHEMDRAEFHTTIAYIPWNYDRPSDPGAVALFRNRPDRFSLCVHGNNHDHREFYRYEDRPDSTWPARPLAEQDADLRQGLARIKAFEKTSGLDVDRVMVFPHGIAPAETLALLNKYHFKATSNVGYVPLDTPGPTDPLFWLRTVTDRFGAGLPSLDRAEPANLTPADIAIDLFLDNPVLFVAHLPFFSDSQTAFNPFARQVNSIQPDTEWVGLGTLAEHLYLMRREDDGAWTVRSFSSDIVLSNPGTESRRYRILKFDNEAIPVQQVLLGGQEIKWSRDDSGYLRMDATVPAKQQRRVRIVYENEPVPATEDLSKPDRRVNLLRHLSEIRDQYLTAGPLGALIQTFYYDSNLYQLGIKALLAAGAAGLLVLSGLFFLIRKKMKQRHG